ncbi:MAG: SRPBCC family protein [Ilumatobacteraceae bacterium]
MAKYVTTIETLMPADEAFAYMADLRNFEEWDPGVQTSKQVEGAGPGPDAEYDVTVDAPGKGLTLRYRTTEYDAPNACTVKASSTMFTSLDRITAERPVRARSSPTTRNSP